MYMRRHSSGTMPGVLLCLGVSFLLTWLVDRQMSSRGGRNDCPLPFTAPAPREASTFPAFPAFPTFPARLRVAGPPTGKAVMAEAAAARTAAAEATAARAAEQLLIEEAAEEKVTAAKAAKAAKTIRMAKAAKTKAGRSDADAKAPPSVVEQEGPHESQPPTLARLPGLTVAARVQATYGWRCELIGSSHFFAGHDIDLVIEVPALLRTRPRAKTHTKQRPPSEPSPEQPHTARRLAREV